jgi:hypothetical protein
LKGFENLAHQETYVFQREAVRHLGCKPSELGKPVRRKAWRHAKMRSAFIPYGRYVAACEKRGVQPADLTRLYWEKGRSHAFT